MSRLTYQCSEKGDYGATRNWPIGNIYQELHFQCPAQRILELDTVSVALSLRRAIQSRNRNFATYRDQILGRHSARRCSIDNHVVPFFRDLSVLDIGLGSFKEYDNPTPPQRAKELTQIPYHLYELAWIRRQQRMGRQYWRYKPNDCNVINISDLSRSEIHTLDFQPLMIHRSGGIEPAKNVKSDKRSDGKLCWVSIDFKAQSVEREQQHVLLPSASQRSKERGILIQSEMPATNWSSGTYGQSRVIGDRPQLKRFWLSPLEVLML